MIVHFLDVILPGDEALSLPSANSLGIAETLKHADNGNQLDRFFQLLHEVADNKFKLPLSELNDEQYLKTIESSKRKDVRLVNFVIDLCLSYYYTNANVLQRISSSPVPVFPEGNTLLEDDWSLLEDVYNRGPIYRI